MLQRDVRNKLWGYGRLPPNKMVIAECNDSKGPHEYQAEQIEQNVWQVQVGPYPAKTSCCFDISSGELTLEAMFGDIWVCSGQSNMEQSMNKITNFEAELKNSAAYNDNIRYAIVKNQVNDVDDDTFNQEMELGWSKANDLKALEKMSAVCFLFARKIYDQTKIPQGLVSADWGGTPIEAWSPQSNIDGCSVPENRGLIPSMDIIGSAKIILLIYCLNPFFTRNLQQR